MNPSIRAGLSTEKAGCTSLFVNPKIAIPGEGVFRTYINTFLGFTGNA